jgi:hypothetical protein
LASILIQGSGVTPDRRIILPRALALAVCASATWLTVSAGASSGVTSDATERLMAALDRAARRPARAYKAVRSLRAELVEKGECGWMEVRTDFTPERGLTYSVISEGGSPRIRGRALKNLLDREVEASRNAEAREAAFSTDNYRYELGGMLSNAVQIGLTPRREDPRLIDGVATMDQRTAELSRVEGDLAKSPSFWLKRVRIARRYAAFGGSTLPVQFESFAHVRMFGPAHMVMTIKYLSIDGLPVADRLQAEDARPASPIALSRP